MSFYDILLAEKLSGGTVPTGKIQITQNGNDIDIAQYATADVSVPTTPTKGIVYSDWDASGYPHTASVYYDGVPPQGFCRKMGYGADLTYTAAAIDYYIDKIILNEGITQIPLRFCEYCKLITEITIPASVTQMGTNAFNCCTALNKAVFSGDVSYSIQGINGYPKQFIFRGQVTQNGNIGNNNVELYDFSGCSQVFTLSATSVLLHADGCVIKVPQSLLAEWQAANVWKDFPTDSAESGYVVWQGV